jgi:hypothetical protein
MRRVTTRLRSRANYALSLHTVTVIDRPILSAPGGDPTNPWIAWWSSDHRPALRFGSGSRTTASVQLRACSLRRMLWTCSLTVRSVITSCSSVKVAQGVHGAPPVGIHC